MRRTPSRPRPQLLLALATWPSPLRLPLDARQEAVAALAALLLGVAGADREGGREGGHEDA
jgi:hypothetical protein